MQPVKAGKKFARLTVLSFEGGNPSTWRCICTCGNHISARNYALKTGHIRSCGCLARDRLIERNKTHGLSKRPEYFVWQGMRARCRNPKNKHFADYGGRGIKICARWQEFGAFFFDMGPRPTPQHTLDRKNNDGHYEPKNCRWATGKEQAANKRRSLSKFLTVGDRTLLVVEWAKETGVKAQTINWRLRNGRTPQQAIA